jgi:putative chitinase
MTPELLVQLMPFSGGRATMFAEPIKNAMAEFAINTPRRQAAFIAQIAHESGSLKYMKELADGSAYEGRADLGNTHPGDGKRYPGRGPIQLTGRGNMLLYGQLLGLDLINKPELLEQPIHGCRASACFWKREGCNELADGDKFGAITKKINGGYNHLDERIAHWLRIRKVLGL